MNTGTSNGVPTLLWVIQNNQITPFLAGFLQIIQYRLQDLLSLSFMVPANDAKALEMTQRLNPTAFKTAYHSVQRSFDAYTWKKELLGDLSFNQGLKISEALLLDDLAGGTMVQAVPEFPDPGPVRGIMLQIPTPLGSTDPEEKIFHAWRHWGRRNQIPVIGYEFLPLDTRWTLAPSMVDTIITTTSSGFEAMTDAFQGSGKPVWHLTPPESRLFRTTATPFNLNGIKAVFHYQHEHGLPPDRPVVYIPHNVALVHEYTRLIEVVTHFLRDIHLMIGVAKDQARGAYSHQELVETVCSETIRRAASHSFHDTNAVWEMSLADVVVSAAACYSTSVAAAHQIPTVIVDPALPPREDGPISRVGTKADLKEKLNDILSRRSGQQDLSTLLCTLSRPVKGRL